MTRRRILCVLAALALLIAPPAARAQAPTASAGNICSYDFLRPSLGEGGCVDGSGNPVLCPAEAEDMLVENLSDLCVDLVIEDWPTAFADDCVLTVSAGAIVCGAGGSGSNAVLDLGDDGTDESTGILEIATTGDTPGIFSEPAPDKLLINVGLAWPVCTEAQTGDTATAFFAAGTLEAARLPAATGAAQGAIILTGDLGGTAATPAVVDDSHAHTDSTVDGLDASATTTGTFAPGLLPAADTTTQGAVVLSTDGEATAGEAVQATDARLSDARTPTGHAATHHENAADELLVEALGTTCTLGQTVTSDGAGGVDCSDTGDAAILFSSGSGAGATTTYLGQGATSATEADVAVVSPLATTAEALFCQASAAPGAGESWTLTLRVAGASSALTCSISEAGTTCSDTANTATLAAADLLSIQATASTAPAAADLACGVRIPGGGGGGGGGGSDPWAGQYHPDREPTTCAACEEWADGTDDLTWRWGNQDGATISYARDALVLSNASGTDDDWACRWTDAPADGDFTASTLVHPTKILRPNLDADEVSLAVLVSGTEASPTTMETLGIRYGVAGASTNEEMIYLVAHQFGSGGDYLPEAGRSEVKQGVENQAKGAWYLQGRYDDTGATWEWWASTDGRSWSSVTGAAFAAAQQPVSVGVCVRRVKDSGEETEGEFDWFRIRTDAAGVGGDVGE